MGIVICFNSGQTVTIFMYMRGDKKILVVLVYNNSFNAYHLNTNSFLQIGSLLMMRTWSNVPATSENIAESMVRVSLIVSTSSNLLSFSFNLFLKNKKNHKKQDLEKEEGEVLYEFFSRQDIFELKQRYESKHCRVEEAPSVVPEELKTFSSDFFL